MYHASFILTQYAEEELNQNNDAMYGVTGVKDTTATKLYTQHKLFNITK